MCNINSPFFMSSGYILLQRQQINCNYSQHKIIGIVRFIFLMSLFCWFARALLLYDFHPLFFLKLFIGAFIQKSKLGMCWYLASMILIYSLLPMLVEIMRKTHTLALSILFLVFLCTIMFVLNVLFSQEQCFESHILQTFRLYNWLFYLVGGLLCKYEFLNQIVKNKRCFFCIVVVCLMFLNHILQEFFREIICSPFCEYFYCSFFVMMLVIVFFALLVSLDIRKSKVVSELSHLFLPVYIVHSFVVQIYKIFICRGSSTNIHFLGINDEILYSSCFYNNYIMAFDENTVCS